MRSVAQTGGTHRGRRLDSRSTHPPTHPPQSHTQLQTHLVHHEPSVLPGRAWGSGGVKSTGVAFGV
jgi:hypothetical protein